MGTDASERERYRRAGNRSSPDLARHAPAPVVGLPANVLELSALSSSVCARYLRGAPDTFGVVCWGRNTHGELGDGLGATVTEQVYPVQVVDIP